MCIHRMVAMCIFVLANPASADEMPIPEFSGEVVKYAEPFGGEFLLAERTPEQLKFWFRKVGGGYHQCSMTGIALSRNNETYKYGSVQRNGDKNIACSLSIIVLDNSVVLLDNGSQCKAIYCGQRSAISGAVFHRID